MQKQLQRKLQTTLAKAETASAEAKTVPAHFVVAPAVVPEKSHKAYLTIFSQIMNLMPNTFLQENDVTAITSVLKSQTFFFWAKKNKRLLILSKIFLDLPSFTSTSSDLVI